MRPVSRKVSGFRVSEKRISPASGTLIRVMKQLTQEQFLGMIRDDVEKTGSQKAVASAMNVSESYLSDVLKGRRDAGDKILRHYRLRAVRNYVPVSKEKE